MKEQVSEAAAAGLFGRRGLKGLILAWPKRLNNPDLDDPQHLQ